MPLKSKTNKCNDIFAPTKNYLKHCDCQGPIVTEEENPVSLKSFPIKNAGVLCSLRKRKEVYILFKKNNFLNSFEVQANVIVALTANNQKYTRNFFRLLAIFFTTSYFQKC